MSTGPIGIAGSAAGVPSASRQNDAEKAKADRAQQSAQAQRDRFSERRDEIVDEAQLGRGQVSDRDADGRLLSSSPREAQDDSDADDESDPSPSPSPSEDDRGSNLDLLA